MRAVDSEITLSRVDELAMGRHASNEELTALDERGFVVVPALLSEDEVDRLRAEFERLVAEDPRGRADELGTRRAKGTIDNEALALCWRHRVVLDSAAHVIGTTFHVSQVHLRDPNPGHGEQRLHPDHGPVPVPGITATWFLDPFTSDNGATRLLPGSHRSPPPSSEVPIPGSEIPVAGESVALGPAGFQEPVDQEDLLI
jgi:ectoine hydroxylase-related dioxygenase (phytanoyl-CoA dioxygenase family)